MVDARAGDFRFLFVFLVFVIFVKVLEINGRDSVELFECTLHASYMLWVYHGERGSFFCGHWEVDAYVQVGEELDEFLLALSAALGASVLDNLVALGASVPALRFN